MCDCKGINWTEKDRKVEIGGKLEMLSESNLIVRFLEMEQKKGLY